ncbi:unnamed protein product [Ectocarpus sp. 12 AP-2014]
MRNFGGLPLVLCTLVFCRLMTHDADALVSVSCGSNAGARLPPALRMDAKGFGRPSSTSEGKTKATRSSKATGESARSGVFFYARWIWCKKSCVCTCTDPGPFMPILAASVTCMHCCTCRVTTVR